MPRTLRHRLAGRQRIAVVGGGAAGLGAAWMLAQRHDVTIYEAAEQLGGHAFAHPFPGTDRFVDMGVVITLPWAYPNLYCMFQQVGVRTSAAAATLHVSFPRADGAGRDSWGTDVSLRQTDLFRRIEADASRFEQLMFEVAGLPLATQTRPISAYLTQSVPGAPNSGGYGQEFITKGLCPLLSLFLVTRESLLDTPAWSLSMMFRFGTLSFFSPTTWRTLDGGTRDYVARLTASFPARRRLGTRVAAVLREARGVAVEERSGRRETYDQVVLATDAITARALLRPATAAEDRLLRVFRYEPAVVYLHQDARVLAGDQPGVFFHYRSEDPSPRPQLDGVMTYDMRRTAGLAEVTSAPVLVSVMSRPSATPFAGTVTEQRVSHMIADAAAIAARLELHTIQGKDRIWFAGDYTTFASHEDAFLSGVVIGEALGATYPFRWHAPALERFRHNRMLMLRLGLGARLGLQARAELLADLAGAVRGEALSRWR